MHNIHSSLGQPRYAPVAFESCEEAVHFLTLLYSLFVPVGFGVNSLWLSRRGSAGCHSISVAIVLIPPLVT